eukprot:CAMPEP_0113711382 /NCGR_PEP_ID=MMETSP0038_2-20120614/30720_1 /TAXON_ID=2898 /ORGANISM="Cryptomonas paramecium" /LENGTH=65 /DNA_ID=CAMNT_0000637621 /DNA_START=218 /DNA_END=412 /DNA_ORIENTATION=- /assembly_acc=CAM_ASM_000170
MTAEDISTVPAMMLPHDHREVGVAALAPKHRLILHPPRPFLALLGLLEPAQWAATDGEDLHDELS